MTERTALVHRLTQVLGTRGEVLEAYLFGSQARGDARPTSDVDVAVMVEPAALVGHPYGYEATLGAELQAALGRNDVDLVLLNRAPPVLYHEILRDGVRLCSQSLAETAVREGQALSRYCDYVPQLAKIEAAHRERGKR